MEYALTQTFAVIAAELEPGERIVWQRHPSPGKLALREMKTFGAGALFTAFSAVWTAAAATLPAGRGGHVGTPDQSPRWPLVLWGLMFVGAGVWMLLAPVRAWWLGGRTVYAITDRRALIVERRLSRRVTSFAGDRLGRLVRSERADGSGHLVFDRVVTPGRRGSQSTHDIGFFGIDSVAEVERLLLDLHRRSLHGPVPAAD